MVNHGILTASLSFPALKGLEVRVCVELRSSDGRPIPNDISDEVMIAKIETVKAVSELMHYEFSKALAEESRSVAETARSVLKGAAPAVVHHDQYVFDLFNEAIDNGLIEVTPQLRA
jgi:hypothetical protein